MSSERRYEDETTDYRRGFVEGQAGERNVYLLCMGGINLDEYNRGFADELRERGEECDE